MTGPPSGAWPLIKHAEPATPQVGGTNAYRDGHRRIGAGLRAPPVPAHQQSYSRLLHIEHRGPL